MKTKSSHLVGMKTYKGEIWPSLRHMELGDIQRTNIY